MDADKITKTTKVESIESHPKQIEDEISSIHCRVCFEEGKSDAFVSPCNCKGSQKYIHLHCLRKWQESILSSNRDPTKAYICGVCNGPFSYKPPKLSLWAKVLKFLGTWHKVLVPVAAVLLFLPTKVTLQCLGIVISTFTIPWAILSYNGLSLTIMNNNRLALIRRGNPVEGLRAGQLLVASNTIGRGSLFHKSVVLLLDHSSREGSRGVIINSPTGGNGANRRLLGLWDQIDDAGQIHVGLGGPVQSNLITILHNRRTLQDSERIAEGIYSARSLDSVVVGDEDADMRVQVLFGYAGWAPQQLDGEVRSGGWHFVDSYEDAVFNIPRNNLWETLSAQIEEAEGQRED